MYDIEDFNNCEQSDSNAKERDDSIDEGAPINGGRPIVSIDGSVKCILARDEVLCVINQCRIGSNSRSTVVADCVFLS